MNVVKEIPFRDKGKVLVVSDARALFEAAAELFVDTAKDAVAKRGRFTVALSGGSTPRSLYQLLATEPWRDRIDWSKAHFFWGDERWVPSTDKQSNYRMANEALLLKVPLPSENIHRIETNGGEPSESAEEYEEEIRKFFGRDPRFDLDLLGIGTNGHTASLFPQRPTLHERERLVVADYIDEVKMNRITFTFPLINASRLNVFLVSGPDKATVLKDVLRGPIQPEQLPSQLVRASSGSELLWLIDAPAAAELE